MILVTGASGFIGSQLVPRLVAQREPVRVLVRRRPVAAGAGVERVSGDLVSGEGIDDALRGVRAVIHLAGTTKALHAREYEEGNVTGAERIAHAAAGRGIRFVHVSSLAAAGPAAGGVPVAEEDPPHPVGIYGATKLAGERAVRAALPDAVIVRPAVVYGPGDTDLLQLLRSISKGIVLEIAGGERWFSGIFVDDLVTALLAAVRTPAAAGRTYNLAHAAPVSWAHLSRLAQRVMAVRARTLRVPVPLAFGVGWGAEQWARLTGRPSIISRDKVKEAVHHHWTCDVRRAAAELGFTAPTPIEEGLPRTLSWYREAGWLRY
ncbi:MAG TPA: NAD-dependent epimerase/dehydratase family protein [Gemmatimonadaceae bacterium]|nr:NAD-dependent epimerase/dehydratase family protein [Gemmatimonadaceae bacterium]